MACWEFDGLIPGGQFLRGVVMHFHCIFSGTGFSFHHPKIGKLHSDTPSDDRAGRLMQPPSAHPKAVCLLDLVNSWRMPHISIAAPPIKHLACRPLTGHCSSRNCSVATAPAPVALT